MHPVLEITQWGKTTQPHVKAVYALYSVPGVYTKTCKSILGTLHLESTLRVTPVHYRHVKSNKKILGMRGYWPLNYN